jgi:hypothetical protein
MKPIPLRTQVRLVAAGYAVVLVTAALLVYMRHLLYVNHPQDAAAAGGMYAAGDWMLEIFIGCMLLVPTFVLVLVIRLGVLSTPAVNQRTMLLGWICLGRLLCSPIVIVGLLVSRLLARFDQAKRLTLYALLIEVLTLALMATLFLFAARAHRG